MKVIAFDGSEQTLRDPYSYGPIMGEVDLHLFAEGNDKRLYDKFGAHLREIGGDRGVYFAVWAPNAEPGQRGGRFQWLGRPGASDAEAGRAAGCGKFSSRE